MVSVEHKKFGEVDVEVHRRDIKNIHLNVLPPNGRVRLSVPKNTSEQSIRIAIVHKLGWIKRQQADFKQQARQSEREMVSGEAHYLWGQKLRLEVNSTARQHSIALKGKTKLQIEVRAGTALENKLKLLNGFYRIELQQQLNKHLPYWEARLGVKASAISIRKMKTKWGSCNTDTKRILINLELAKKPVECLEFILVHELVHLLERHHNKKFVALMDKHLPDWRERRNLLNSLPLAYEDWIY